MREILFRGKRAGNGEWVGGVFYKQVFFYGELCVKCYIITSIESLDYDQAFEYFEVIPETVGQFTGAIDKNGTEIYEGDIVRYELSAYGKSLTKDYEIVFHNYSWGCKNEKGNISRLDLFEPSLLEVIGNKHER